MEITELLQKFNLNHENAPDKDGNTVLHLIIKNKEMTQTEIIEALKISLDKNFDVNIENKRKETALHLAVMHRMRDVIEFLVERKANRDQVVKFFIEDEYKKFRDLSRQDEIDEKEVQEMEKEGANFMEWLISKGFNFENPRAVSMATKLNLQHILPVLLKSTKDIIITDEKNRTLLHLFLEADNDVIYEKLNSNIFSEYYIQKNLAEKFKYYPIYKNFYSDRYAVDIVRSLLNMDIDKSQLNKKDATGTSSIHVAAKNASRSIVQMLIEHGARINCRNNKMETPLHFAMRNNVEVVKLLLKFGADADAKDFKGETALHKIAIGPRTMHSRDTIKLLLEWGAKLVDFTNKGSSVLCYGRSRDHHDYEEACEESKFNNLMNFEDDLEDEWGSLEMELLTEHSLKLKAADFPWDQEFEDWVYFCPVNTYQSDHYKETYAYCLKEVQKLKSTFINDQISLYTLLHMNLNQRLAYLNNEKWQKLVHSSKLKKKFPNYFVLILSSYREVRTRKSLLAAAKEAWLQLTNINLPDICTECIFSFLSNSNLFSMIEEN